MQPQTTFHCDAQWFWQFNHTTTRFVYQPNERDFVGIPFSPDCRCVCVCVYVRFLRIALMCSNPIESALRALNRVIFCCCCYSICAAIGWFKLKIENYAAFEWKMDWSERERKKPPTANTSNSKMGAKKFGRILYIYIDLKQILNIKSVIRRRKLNTSKSSKKNPNWLRKLNSIHWRWCSSESDVFWFICLNILGKWLATNVIPYPNCIQF